MAIRNLVLAGIVLASIAPLAAAECTPSCNVGATFVAYVTSATVIHSGDNVTWTSLDGMEHTATPFEVRPCLNALVDPEEPGQAWFRIEGNRLESSPNEDGPWRHCDSATSLAGNGFALRYACRIHGNHQQGVLVVRPAA